MTKKNAILDSAAVERSLKRIAHEIIERNGEQISQIALVGIHTRGVPLARRLAGMVKEFARLKEIPVGSLDISFHRDDTEHAIPIPKSTDVPFDIENKIIVLVDDVLYTGRTIRAALNALFDLGRTAGVQLAVLVDRGHRQLPIRPDYVGKNLPTSLEERVKVDLQEIDGTDEVKIETS